MSSVLREMQGPASSQVPVQSVTESPGGKMNSSSLGELNSPGRQALSWAVWRIHLVRRVSLVPLWKLGHSMVQWSEARVAKVSEWETPDFPGTGSVGPSWNMWPFSSGQAE